MIAFLLRLRLWLSTSLLGIKPLERLDADLCPVCGCPKTPTGYHDFGQFVEQP